ncbi:MAG: hypothetical protein HY922_14730 [Elusimicrobia bacterium]|nr:hypothetical protein [Elusimicrobiota bacterium]
MCGKYDSVKGKLACVSICLGVVCAIVGGLMRLTGACVMSLGPRTFAIGAALLFLFAIAGRSCACHTHEEEKKQ